ncbi:MAG: hypothetical protein WBG30_12545, partial [Psychrilyobacter sp.]|uniref:cyclic GMP-AMP synthase DncV-like nucleotidyltransferase n=1 Tax=Psychrilyobacter sp. TaxID=2586924 RepID=UPI003C7927A3
SNHNELKNKREILQADLENKLPDKLLEEGITEINKSDLTFIDQGSWAQGVKTSIKPKKIGENGNKTFDRDVAVIIPMDIVENSDPRKLKKIIRDIFIITDKRNPKIKDPCVTVTYSKEGDEIYHIDFPIYAKDEDGNLYLARGKETTEKYEWEPSDPEGLNEYFRDNYQDDEGNQKRRIIRYIKQWKQEKYNGSNGNEIPPSIGLTLLGCNDFKYSYDGEYWNDLEALHLTLQDILGKFTIYYDGSVNISCNLPKTPWSDVFYKMRDSEEHLKTFYKRFKKFADNIENAYNAEHDHEAAKYVIKSLGDKFEIPEKEAKKDNSTLKKEDRFA